MQFGEVFEHLLIFAWLNLGTRTFTKHRFLWQNYFTVLWPGMQGCWHWGCWLTTTCNAFTARLALLLWFKFNWSSISKGFSPFFKMLSILYSTQNWPFYSCIEIGTFFMRWLVESLSTTDASFNTSRIYLCLF